MIINIFQIIVLFILSSYIINFIPKIKYILAMFLGIFISLEISSLFSLNSFIDYRFYSHMSIDSVKSFGGLFIKESVLFILASIFITFLLIIFSKIAKNRLKYLYKFPISIVTSILLIYILFLPNGIFYNLYSVYKILNTKNKNFYQSLKKVGIDPKQYTALQNLKAIKGKNIIILSLESLEQGYLYEPFKNLTPNLSKLSKEWTFYNKMPVSPGASWTAGSLYTHQIGIPAFFKGKGFNYRVDKADNMLKSNKIFQNTFSSKLLGLGNVFNKADYDYRYLMGNIEFAGTKDILKTYGYKTVSEKNSIGKYAIKEHGLDDYDLFKEAKLQIEDLTKNKNKPFALFISTINSHFPDGIYDKRMEKYISKKDNDLEFSVAATDYLVGNFIKYLQSKHLLDNTAIFIFPDHTLLGYGGDVHNKLSQHPRELYLITNIPKDKFTKKPNQKIYQADLPRMIIEGAEIKTNIKFLRDFVKTDNFIKFIKENRENFAALNQSALEKRHFDKDFKVYLKDRTLFLDNGDYNISKKVNLDYDIADFIFIDNMVFLKKERPEDFRTAINATKNDLIQHLIHILVSIENGKISNVYFGNKHKVGLAKNGDNITFNKYEIKNIVDSIYIKNSVSIPKIKRFNNSKKIANKIFDLSNNLNAITVSGATLHKDKNSSLLLNIESNDPKIIINSIKPKTDFVLLKLKIESSSNAYIKFYYKPKYYNYTEHNAFINRVKSGTQEIDLLIPRKSIKNSLRIDFENFNKNLTILELSIYELK